MGSSDPFVAISRTRPDGTRMQVWKSSVVQKNTNPSWAEVSVPVQVLCNGEMDAPLVLEVYDWDSSGSHNLIGGMSVSTNGLLQMAQMKAGVPLSNPAKSGPRGMFFCESARIVSHPTLLDYVAGGAQLNLMVGVDYTGSNGAPHLPNSLHQTMDLSKNEYLGALRAVGSILLEYCAGNHNVVRVGAVFESPASVRALVLCAAKLSPRPHPTPPSIPFSAHVRIWRAN